MDLVFENCFGFAVTRKVFNRNFNFRKMFGVFVFFSILPGFFFMMSEREFNGRGYYLPQENKEVFRISELRHENCALSHIGKYLELDYDNNKFNEKLDITVNRVNGFITINVRSMYNIIPLVY